VGDIISLKNIYMYVHVSSIYYQIKNLWSCNATHSFAFMECTGIAEALPFYHHMVYVVRW